MKVYGSKICIDCRNYLAIQKKRGFQAEYVEITENTDLLKEFLRIRDKDSIFEKVKENGGIGIPLFVNEAFSWIGQKPVSDTEIEEK